MKVCSKCKEEKDESEFCKDIHNKDGLHGHCKNCKAEYQKEYYKNTKEIRVEYQKEYYKKNKAYKQKYKRMYNEINKEKIEEYHRKHGKIYREINKEKVYIKNRVYRSKKDFSYRGLGYEPLNKPFRGSHCHHLIIDKEGEINLNICIFIPEELHNSIPHNSNTWKGMDKINAVARDFLEKQEKGEISIE
jgi:hypothetical protein